MDNSFSNESSKGLYGLFLCRGDVSSTSCQNCVNDATKQIRERCLANKTAIMWYDECMVRYSGTNFFGVVEIMPKLLMYSTGTNNSEPDKPDVDVQALMYPMITDAANSNMLFKTNESPGNNESLRRYGQNCVHHNQLHSHRLMIKHISIKSHVVTAGKKENNTTMIVVITLSSVAGVAALFGLLYYFFFGKKKGQGESQQFLFRSSEGLPSTELVDTSMLKRDDDNNGEVKYFSLSTIRAATKSFSDTNKLGEGGFGPVYKIRIYTIGILINGKEIAVKRLSMRSRQGLEEFKTEVNLIAKLQHKNLVKLLGCCLEQDEKLLVYEYMANTSLDAFLFDITKCIKLHWDVRTNIVNGIARGLVYLHEDSRLKIIHRDLKASNILLDDEMNPKISDFGTARIFGNNQIDANTDRVVGTYRYMAPEYAMEGLFSIKSDVYSFGVLLLEIVTGKKNNGIFGTERTQSLPSYVWQQWSEDKGEETIDPNLINACPVNEALRWIHISLLCVQEDPNDRPNMSSVVLMLPSKSLHLPKPSKPPFSADRLFLSDQFSTSGTGTGFQSSDQTSTGVSF
ncbi:cysteine-rich receptor-like protein kinase 44 [Ziziphus jujuba]|uniref:Cysteine-rich receptor-like protein kinase 44 n=1 Tax=Ziziphus jujuba TaxID=326968 RepID=A0ABM3ZSV5_ZIZJJ|nr:cysteine-rich receptor-like protein kinase 44 [Ziziphus jujuba]